MVNGIEGQGNTSFIGRVTNSLVNGIKSFFKSIGLPGVSDLMEAARSVKNETAITNPAEVSNKIEGNSLLGNDIKKLTAHNAEICEMQAQFENMQ
ncbi:MAG: hypothetical protein DKM50_08265 [Candidatus Margulisiibacteriota bacterium]|nr:MAG: hypothetical protein A2X43_03045 [Candidatus Margulisbacteria bacterium GWD2_39_127]OGI04989.1 MAG: hypothetical protein A2X42_05310 [Candidatus Margulisbacteria bacterium GWF2_38_17]PZM79589.1 MAG: hypothetical protein DKM50_08265 [Candidatus Margulisiibacteriota bacterium]HAR63229.1 hypothetical protein [Candidatus Margulisiibacteriota bacterium]HCY35619.1 hypothetical protein [Candidatus Margulisiibacteriota bacterium]